MLVPDIDDLILDYEGEGALEELGRRILSRGPWTAVAFLVRTRSSADGPWEGPFLWLHRYQKVAQGWKLVSRFHTTDPDQLESLVQAFGDWGIMRHEPQ